MIPRPPRPTLFPYTTLFRSISLLGGSRVQIAGPTGAFMPILYLIVQRHGYDGLAIATVMAGVILIVDRKSTRLNSSHSQISYAVFCLKKKKTMMLITMPANK